MFQFEWVVMLKVWNPGEAAKVIVEDVKADIGWLSGVLSCRPYANSRRFLDGPLLRDAVASANGWGDRLPGWYFYYAYSSAVGEMTRTARLRALEQVLEHLAGAAFKNLRADLRKSGFKAAQRAFEVALMSAGLSLPVSCNVQLNARTGSGCNMDLSAEFGGRPLFLEATSFQQNKAIIRPRGGTALLGTNLGRKR